MAAKQKKTITVEEFLQEIRRRAYEVFEERIQRNEPGDEMSDWLVAETEIKFKYNIV